MNHYGHRRWLVLYTRPRWERKTVHLLYEQSIEVFFPMLEEIHVWSDRKKVVAVPLFPGYIFVRIGSERERMKALATDGAMKYVHFGGSLAVVRDEIIENVRLAITRPRDLRVEKTQLYLGKEVRIQRGPLRGLTGTLVEYRGHTRVAITIEAIRQTISIEVPVSDLVQLTPA
ncbi:MAG: UpxY family transcription antiterminator [Chlorobi bacterium]|nr:UpxY family transcription antiterminator [Chlorobiota bacterium]